LGDLETFQKLLALATHEKTPIDEARAAALGACRLIVSAKLRVLSDPMVARLDRVRGRRVVVQEHEDSLVVMEGPIERGGRGHVAHVVLDKPFGFPRVDVPAVLACGVTFRGRWSAGPLYVPKDVLRHGVRMTWPLAVLCEGCASRFEP
jgi:hypothetical protein